MSIRWTGVNPLLQDSKVRKTKSASYMQHSFLAPERKRRSPLEGHVTASETFALFLFLFLVSTHGDLYS